MQAGNVKHIENWIEGCSGYVLDLQPSESSWDFFFFKLSMYLNINEVPRPSSSGFKIPIPMTVYRIIKNLTKYFFDNLVICKDIMMFLESWIRNSSGFIMEYPYHDFLAPLRYLLPSPQWHEWCKLCKSLRPQYCIKSLRSQFTRLHFCLHLDVIGLYIALFCNYVETVDAKIAI